MLFNGSAAAEIFTASANGGRLLFARNLGNIVMDVNDVETIDLNALGNTDTIIVNDLAGTEVSLVDLDLAGVVGGTTGDGQADTVIVNGSNAANAIDVAGAGTSVAAMGLAAQVSITNAEGANDSLVINALGGNDTITATTLSAGVIKLTMDGGAGNDTMLGSQGADVFLGGDGDDSIFGDNGNDLALMGAGNDSPPQRRACPYDRAARCPRSRSRLPGIRRGRACSSSDDDSGRRSGPGLARAVSDRRYPAVRGGSKHRRSSRVGLTPHTRQRGDSPARRHLPLPHAVPGPT